MVGLMNMITNWNDFCAGSFNCRHNFLKIFLKMSIFCVTIVLAGFLLSFSLCASRRSLCEMRGRIQCVLL